MSNITDKVLKIHPVVLRGLSEALSDFLGPGLMFDATNQFLRSVLFVRTGAKKRNFGRNHPAPGTGKMSEPSNYDPGQTENLI